MDLVVTMFAVGGFLACHRVVRVSVATLSDDYNLSGGRVRSGMCRYSAAALRSSARVRKGTQHMMQLYQVCAIVVSLMSKL